MSVEKTYIETYAKDSDMTFIVEDTLVNGRVAFSEVKGFYHGKPDPQLTEKYYNIPEQLQKPCRETAR